MSYLGVLYTKITTATMAVKTALFGGFGAVAGIGGKNKSSKEYLISIEWKSGEKSLVLLDDEYYKVFIASIF